MAGCLLFAAGGLGVLLLVGVVIGGVAQADAAGWLIVVGVVGGLGLLAHRKEKAKEQEKAERERQKQQRRKQARADARAQRARGTDWFEWHRRHPVDAETPLPRRWARPVQQARTAVENYRRVVEALRESPQRQRLHAQQHYLAERAAECDWLARRTAELDRQLRQLRKRNQQVRAQQEAVKAAEARLQEMAGELDRLAAQAAQVSVTQSMDDVAALDEAVEVLRRDLKASVDAFHDLGSPTSDTAPAGISGADVSAAGAASEASEEEPPLADGRSGVSRRVRNGWGRARQTLRHASPRRR